LEATIASTRGNSFKTINNWVTKQISEEDYELFLAKMKPEVANSLSKAESRLWYPLEHLTEIYEHIVKEVGNGNPSILSGLGSYLAEVDLGGVLRPLVAFVSVPSALRRTPHLWPRYDDSGDFRLASLDEHNKKATLELADYDGGSLHCIIIKAWLKRGCEILGGKNVTVEEINCRWKNGGNLCRWELKWQ
jgi:hypothetical protein